MADTHEMLRHIWEADPSRYELLVLELNAEGDPFIFWSQHILGPPDWHHDRDYVLKDLVHGNPDLWSYGDKTSKLLELSRPQSPSKIVGDNPNDSQVGGDHYRQKTIQPWDYIAANGLGFFEGNIVKYLTRWENKGGLDDLKKARHYLDKLISLVEGPE